MTQALQTATWSSMLAGEKQKPYFQAILSFLQEQRTNGKIIYPEKSDIFNALKLTPYQNVKVVIIGQDPYHGPNQAHGLCFSVQRGVRPPPSLQNIFKELHDDLSIVTPTHGCLEKWAQQGVLLLNSILTVEARKPQSHANIGWQQFTDKIITVLNEHSEGLVFMLWGSYAQKKCHSIDPARHCILKSVHPSPLSAHRGFLGCRHFSKANEYLKHIGRGEIDWSL